MIKALNVICVIVLILLFSCKPENEQITKDSLSLNFDTDTLLFDTIFTEQLSYSKRFKIYNPSENAISISSIRLGGMNNSNFSLIINGLKSNQTSDLYIRGKDSVLILVNATIDKQIQSNPFLVLDSVIFTTNNQIQKVYLTAWGRKATYYKGDTISVNTTWDSTSARFIYKSIVVAKGALLTIERGTHIHAIKGAGIIVGGTLMISGDTSKRHWVTFNGPRLDAGWEKVPGQWAGITFLPGSNGNIINWAVINNAENAIVLGQIDGESSELKLTNTIVQNISANGIASYHSNLLGWNNLVTNCAGFCLSIYQGGKHQLYNNTFTNYENVFRRSLAGVYISDGDPQSKKDQPIDIELINNIFWGSLANELEFKKTNAANWTQSLANNIIRSDNKEFGINNSLVYNFKNDDKNYRVLINKPGFMDEFSNNYRIDSTSIAIKKGQNLSDKFVNDLSGKARIDTFDIGAYQYFKLE